VAGAKHEVLRELRAEDLQADRQSLGESARNRETGQAGHVGGDREQVGEVHGERVLRFLADREGDGGTRRAEQQVVVLERSGVLLRDHRAHLLGLSVERVVIAGGEGVRADEDAPARLWAEALPARTRIEGGQIAVASRTKAVANAVVAGEVRAGFRRGDEVVAGQAVVD
jgi:hypothetical protein